jgi:UDPglucose 6-dehydrogenase
MVTVFGLGFVGLTTALGFAEQGVKVFGIDINSERCTQLQNGVIPFFEPHLGDILAKTQNKTLHITEDIKTAITESRYVFFCVGTPYGEDGAADLTYLFSAIDDTVNNVSDDIFRVLVIKSTVPPSTTSERVLPYLQTKKGNYGLANNPEFLREGYCWDDFINADRIVLGCADNRSKEMLTELYKPFGVPIITTSHNTGEFIKYLSNTLLATMISYSNEMAEIANYIGDIDIKKAFKTVHMDKRWGGCSMTSYVYPGCGYGGYCLPKDTSALFAQAKQKGFTASILHEVITLNKNMPTLIAKKIARTAKIHERIGILGLSFKPNSDDVRDTPSAKIIKELIHLGYTNIVAHDPIAIEEFKKHYHFDIEYSENKDQMNADVLVITTAWDEYKMTEGRVVDCRYCMQD